MKRLKHIVRLYWHSRKVWHNSDFWKRTRLGCLAVVFIGLFVGLLEIFWWHKWAIGIFQLILAAFNWFFNWRCFMKTMIQEREFYEQIFMREDIDKSELL